MKIGSISYSAPMIRAKREGRKTQTRRTIKPQPRLAPDIDPAEVGPAWDAGFIDVPCSYGRPGDLLIVREATWIWCKRVPNGTTKTGRQKYRYEPVGRHVVYCADQDKPTHRIDDEPDHLWRYKTARFMPRWASRMTDRLTDVRVQRLQEISDEDAKAEGIEIVGGQFSCSPYRNYRKGETGEMAMHCSSAARSFMTLWESINGPGSWDANPYVWALSFDVIHANVDQVLREAA